MILHVNVVANMLPGEPQAICSLMSARDNCVADGEPEGGQDDPNLRVGSFRSSKMGAYPQLRMKVNSGELTIPIGLART